MTRRVLALMSDVRERETPLPSLLQESMLVSAERGCVGWMDGMVWYGVVWYGMVCVRSAAAAAGCRSQTTARLCFSLYRSPCLVAAVMGSDRHAHKHIHSQTSTRSSHPYAECCSAEAQC